MRTPRHAPSILVWAVAIIAVIAAAVLAAAGHLAPAGAVLLAGALMLSYGIRRRARAQLVYNKNPRASAHDTAATQPVDLTMRREYSR